MISKENNYVFIDNQNLFAELKRCEWTIDYEKLYIFLKEKYSAKRIFICIGFLERNINFYEKLCEFGYELIFKRVLITQDIIKGNCDFDLILHCIFRIKDYDKAVIITGDGDFYCLVEYLVFKEKLKVLLVPNRNSYSSLLKKFKPLTNYLNEYQQRLSFQKKSPDKDRTLEGTFSIQNLS